MHAFGGLLLVSANHNLHAGDVISLSVLRFVELDRKPTGNLEVSHEAVAVVFALLRELDSA